MKVLIRRGISLLVSDGHIVEDDRVDYLAAGADLDPAADTALGHVALIAYLYVLLHRAVEADLLNHGREALMIGLLGPLVLFDLAAELHQEILGGGRRLPEEAERGRLESEGVLVGKHEVPEVVELTIEINRILAISFLHEVVGVVRVETDGDLDQVLGQLHVGVHHLADLGLIARAGMAELGLALWLCDVLGKLLLELITSDESDQVLKI